jgi:Arabinose-binding domain of AraC transcription regulator, N-term
VPAKVHSADCPTTAGYGLWPWIELVRRSDIDLERLCRYAGVSMSALREPFARWSQTTCNRVAEFACEFIGPDAAMAAARTVEAGHFQLLELLIRSAATVGDGLRIGCSLFPLLHWGGRLAHEQLANGSRVVTWQPPQDYVVHHGYVELTFGVTVLGIRRETGTAAASASAVTFRHALRGPVRAYESALGCTPQFGAAEDRLVFDAAVAKLAMKRQNPELHRTARVLAEEMLASDET